MIAVQQWGIPLKSGALDQRWVYTYALKGGCCGFETLILSLI